MRIGHIGSIIACAVICDRIFFHRVGDFRTILIFRQIIKCPAPAIGSGDFLALYFLTIGKQADRYALRSCAVLVIVVIPGLGTIYRNGFRCMRIGYGISGLRISCDCHVVLCDIIFLYRIDNVLTSFLCIQFLECC